MLTEYECAVNKGHKMSCGEPQTPAPQCCGQPMVLAMTSGAPLAVLAPQPAGSALQSVAAPQSPRKGGRKTVIPA